MGTRGAQAGEKNPNWKGGRSIASNGYVLVKAVGHRLADVRGYVYEHRLVAEKKIRRKLEDGEHVHHLNGDKTDNRPENIEVLSSQAEHRLRHRSAESKLRLPNEPNPIVECACGCGERFSKFDGTGRPRSYISGHNVAPPHLRPLNEEVECACGCGFTFLKYGPRGKPRRYRSGHSSRVRNIKPKLVECACGCGERLSDFDKWGRPRQYVSGHNSKKEGGNGKHEH